MNFKKYLATFGILVVGSYAMVAQVTCIDLHLSQVAIISQKRKKATIQVTIQNKSSQVWEQTTPLDIQAFWSGDKKFNSGDILCGGTTEKHCTTNKKLLPNETATIKLKVSLRKKTKFNNYLVTVLDPFFVIDECDETNNTAAILLR